MQRFAHWLMGGALSVVLGGCGTKTPDMQDFWENEQKAIVQLDELTDHTTCEIVSAFQAVLTDNVATNTFLAGLGQPTKDLSSIAQWKAQVIFTLTVDEKSQFNPGGALNSVYANGVRRFKSGNVNVGQTGALTLAGQYSPEAARKITVGYSFYLRDFITGAASKKLGELSKKQKGIRCFRPGGTFTDGDLKFYDTLRTALLPATNNDRDPYGSSYMSELKTYASKAKKDVIQHEVTFTLIYGASVTPSLKLVDLSVNQAANPFLGVQRTNTQDVLITVGPEGNDIAGATLLSAQIVSGFSTALSKSQN